MMRHVTFLFSKKGLRFMTVITIKLLVAFIIRFQAGQCTNEKLKKSSSITIYFKLSSWNSDTSYSQKVNHITKDDSHALK